MYRMGIFLGGCKNFKYFLGVFDIPDIFIFWGGGKTVDVGPKPTYEENMGVMQALRKYPKIHRHFMTPKTSPIL